MIHIWVTLCTAKFLYSLYFPVIGLLSLCHPIALHGLLFLDHFPWFHLTSELSIVPSSYIIFLQIPSKLTFLSSCEPTFQFADPPHTAGPRSRLGPCPQPGAPLWFPQTPAPPPPSTLHSYPREEFSRPFNKGRFDFLTSPFPGVCIYLTLLWLKEKRFFNISYGEVGRQCHPHFCPFFGLGLELRTLHLSRSTWAATRCPGLSLNTGSCWFPLEARALILNVLIPLSSCCKWPLKPHCSSYLCAWTRASSSFFPELLCFWFPASWMWDAWISLLLFYFHCLVFSEFPRNVPWCLSPNLESSWPLLLPTFLRLHIFLLSVF